MTDSWTDTYTNLKGYFQGAGNESLVDYVCWAVQLPSHYSEFCIVEWHGIFRKFQIVAYPHFLKCIVPTSHGENDLSLAHRQDQI